MNTLRADQISPLAIFKIGIGPSSSHTMGPMLAAHLFREQLARVLSERDLPNARVKVELFGSLAATGLGHCTDGAVCAGLVGLNAQDSELDQIWNAMPKLCEEKKFQVGDKMVSFDPFTDLVFDGWTIDGEHLPHPNTMRYSLLNADELIFASHFASLGGGFVDPIVDGQVQYVAEGEGTIPVPYPYNTADEFLNVCEQSGLSPVQIVTENEKARGTSEVELRSQLRKILRTFEECIERGLHTEGILPGGLEVRRRAKALFQQMKSGGLLLWSAGELNPSVYAIAVNEENAAGGRVVTAPTNGSSGLIPGVWRTLREAKGLSEDTLIDGLIVAAVIGALVKVRASISGAEVGCQGEVGTSCAMAAGGATAMLGGTPLQIEQAAEIGIEHHLGLTCDPIKGLVQVPCIERNALGAVKALNAAALALASDGSHLVTLDKVLAVMKQTGLDMHQKYKETATGGLALG